MEMKIPPEIRGRAGKVIVFDDYEAMERERMFGIVSEPDPPFNTHCNSGCDTYHSITHEYWIPEPHPDSWYNDWYNQKLSRGFRAVYERKSSMSGLYTVFIVSISSQEVVSENTLIAGSEDEAKMKSLSLAINSSEVDVSILEDYDFTVRLIGEVRKPPAE